jgi:uncharacterized membrane protein YphA (DoxX/SURF4 family)
MDSRHRSALAGGLVAAAAFAVLPGRVRAHVDYVTDPPEAAVDGVAFLVGALSSPLNAALVGGGVLTVAVLVAVDLRFRPAVPDVAALREALAEYDGYVPWMLRLSLGLPLVGAGFAGYLFSPAVPADARLLQVGLGFFILFGLATRVVAAAGLGAYLLALALEPALILAVEYVPGFLAIALLGGGRPSADHLLWRVARTDGTYYGRVDPVHRVAERFGGALDRFERYVPTALRVGLGVAFAYLGLVEKLANPARALQVVERYDLTAVVPVDAGLWVVGAGLTEIGVGVLLVAGFYTRGAAAVAFLTLVGTLFGLPDDPVLAHVTLFGLLSAVFTLGAGPYSLDAWLATDSPRAERPEVGAPPADD